MALTMKDSVEPQPQSDQGSHTQESGDECPSANLVHFYTNTYVEMLTNSDQPKQHSSVRLILNEKMKEFELTSMDEKVPLSVDLGPEPQKVSSEEDTTSLDLMMPQNPTSSTNTAHEEEAAEPTPETSTFITMEEEITSEDDCPNVEDGEHPAEDEPVEQQRGRKDDKSKKRKRTCRALMANKKRLMIGVIIAIVVIVAIGATAGFVAGTQQKNSGSNNNGSINSGVGKPNSGPDINGSASYCPGSCFTCMDKGKCLNMTAIFRNIKDVDPIYQKNKTQPFPKCLEMKAPENNTCSVCFDQDAIRICCSNVPEIMVEESGGSTIKDIQKECEIPPTPEPAGN